MIMFFVLVIEKQQVGAQRCKNVVTREHWNAVVWECKSSITEKEKYAKEERAIMKKE